MCNKYCPSKEIYDLNWNFTWLVILLLLLYMDCGNIVETSIQTIDGLNAKGKLEGIGCYQNIFIYYSYVWHLSILILDGVNVSKTHIPVMLKLGEIICIRIFFRDVYIFVSSYKKFIIKLYLRWLLYVKPILYLFSNFILN